MLHKYHVIYIVRYYPWFHVTAVVLGTYYPWIRGHYYNTFLGVLFSSSLCTCPNQTANPSPTSLSKRINGYEFLKGDSE
jgi:hypothetical protein